MTGTPSARRTAFVPISSAGHSKFNTRRKAEADAIEAFLVAHRGALPFEFVAPTSAWAVAVFRFGTGDGARTQFLLERPLAPGGPVELVPVTEWGAPPVLFRDGVPLVAGTGYALSASGLVTFVAAPAAGAALTFTGGRRAGAPRRLRELVYQREGIQRPRRQRGVPGGGRVGASGW
ncbi:DUF2460 domain-containing protein [Myxococcus sp. XM-1-1-1]|nr:DUF2460 domain-containing protein [Myxococcus sp. XM-1-1-1]